MRTRILILVIFALYGFSASDKTLTRKERKFAIKYLKQTRDGLLKDVKNLTAAQLNFKTDSGRWSIAQCIEHIAIAESSLMYVIKQSLLLPPDPAKRAEITASDTTVIRVVTDRSHKSSAPEQLRPHDKFSSTAEALQEFVMERDLNIEFVDTTQADLRDHFPPRPHAILGVIDDYQAILLIGAHSRRHTEQIEEVMAAPNFPGK